VRVLIVDDEPGIRDLICSVLVMNGYETLEARNGLEALELARQCPCDLVITDQVMPGMSGLELIERLSAEQYPASYLLISGFGLLDEETGGLPFLAKPFTVTELVEVLEKVARQPTLPELERAWWEARKDWEKAIGEMEGILMEVPSKIPHPDGTLLIEQAGQKRRTAFEKYIKALRKYRTALKQGGVPVREDHHSD
jgi:two-component system, response regulator, stage 0 sporulation protein F